MQKKVKYAMNQSGETETGKGRTGHVIVIEDRCKGCSFCIANCPMQVLRMSSVFNKRGYHPPDVFDASKCVNCHFCEVLCPEFAIYSVANDGLND